jgi:hypothetical protein
MSSILAIFMSRTGLQIMHYVGLKMTLGGSLDCMVKKIGYNRWCGEMSSRIRRDRKLQFKIRSIAIKWDSPWGIHRKNIAGKRY